MLSKWQPPSMAFSTLRWQARNLNANTAFDIMGESIDKACLYPNCPRTQIAFTPRMYGFPGKENQSSQRS